ncbi:MAG: hypothetical protein KAI17_02075 [Thiotrichaceae bacterium]|nr:hypothetical protein [Thiotrichaceae bacterium]
MPNLTLNLTETAIRLYRQLFGSPNMAGQLADGLDTVLEGHTAIAVTEACISEVAVLGSSFMTQGSALAWLSEQQRVTYNLFEQPLSIQQADSPRGALASAIGVTQSGHRSSLFLSAPELSACQDLLQLAVARHLPLVIHLDNYLSVAQTTSIGSGHETVHQVMDSGCVVLFASHVQEAVDFTLVARHLAEMCLTPVIVVMDGLETGISAQDVCLPSNELVKQFIGRADELITTPSIAQKHLFSEHRCRIPNWHDLDKPVLQGAMQDPKLFALGQVARETYFTELIRSRLAQVFVQYQQLTARQYASVSSYHLKKAEIIIIAQGDAIETVKTLSRYLRRIKGIHLGVIGLHILRPFDTADLMNQLQQSSTAHIVVLERMNTPLAEHAPLMREIRAGLDSQTTHSLPELHSVIYGLGGSELSRADLYVLCEALKNNTLTGKYLGIPFISYDIKNAKSKTKETYPKRQVMLDSLERYYPQIKTLGITNTQYDELALGSSATAFTSYAVSYIDDHSGISYAMDLATYLYKLNKGCIRSTIHASWEQCSQRKTDYITQSDRPYTADSSSLVDFFLLLNADSQSLLMACQKLSVGGVVIFNQLPTYNRSIQDIHECLILVSDKKLTFYPVSEWQNEAPNHALIWEEIVASLTAVLIDKEAITMNIRKIIALREAMSFDDLSQTHHDAFKQRLNATIDNHHTVSAEDFLKQQLKQQLKQMSKIDNVMLIEGDSKIPDRIKHLGQSTDTYYSLPRFWDQIGILQQQGEMDQLTTDPYLATGTIPSLSAIFNDMSVHRHGKTLPVFDPKFCTACGDCWSNCPESAIATVAIHPKTLIETGIKLAGADALRAVSAKLASHIARMCRHHELDVQTSGELLQEAFEQFKEKANMPEERLHSIEKDFHKAQNAIADLPITLSDPLFYSPEKKQNDSGELFSLVINPKSCKACNLCIERCATQANDHDQAVAMRSHSMDEPLPDHQYHKQWSIWEKTPDTSSATIERLRKEAHLSAGSVLMLSRYNAFALSGGDQSELASGEKIAVRQLLSATEYHQQPLMYQFISELDRLRDALKAEINHVLSEALPTDNLNLLAEKLSDVKVRQVDLNTLLQPNERVMDTHSIDASRTHQLVNLVLAINKLHWQLSEGISGLGRARYSLCITSSSIASWAGTFPNNPFHVPVNIDASGESTQVAMGLMQGQMNDLLQAISLMRQAKACVDPRYAKQTEKRDQLRWQDLSHEEKQLCPPLFLIGGDDLLGTHGFSQIALLLNSDYPIKVVVFNELGSGLVSEGVQQYHLNRRQDSSNHLAMMAMSQQNAYVAQTSFADSDHFQHSVQQLLANDKAGLLSIHSPSPQRHGFRPEETIKQAELAVNSGMFPLFQYNPQKEGVFGSRLSLHEVVAQPNNELNPVHWAINETRFQAHFSELESNAVSPIDLANWLVLSDYDKTKKTPFIVLFSNDNEGETHKVTISQEFASMIAEQQNTQRTLQELAGIVTPFTDSVEKTVTERLSTEHQAEINALHADYEAKMKQLEDNYQSQTHATVRNQLLRLAGYGDIQ